MQEFSEELIFEQASEQVKVCFERASDYFNQELPLCPLSFKLRGRNAGLVRFPAALDRGRGQGRGQDRGRQLPEIRLNRQMLLSFPQHFHEQIIPHEVAHAVAYFVYGRNIRPHGREWQQIMQQVYGRQPRVTHNLPVESSNRRQYSYRCDCDDVVHQFGVVRHRRASEQQQIYICKSCRQPLHYAPEVASADII